MAMTTTQVVSINWTYLFNKNNKLYILFALNTFDSLNMQL
jgi:hypothetical protein